MASISKLAVVISGQTAPLEQAMKKVESKMHAFKHSFKEGAMLGAGVIGVDKLEQAMKKALAENEDLAEAAEKAELSFGRILLRITGIQAALPTVSRLLSGMSDHIESGGLSNDWQVFKEQAASIWMVLTTSDSGGKGFNIQTRLNLMRDEYEEAVRLQRAQDYLVEKEKERLKLAKEREETVANELKAIESALESKLNSLDPQREEKQYQELKKESKDPFVVASIELKKMRIAQLESEKEAQDELNKYMEEGKKVTEEYESETEKMIREQSKLDDLLYTGAISMKTYERGMEALSKKTFTLRGMFNDLAEELQKKDIADFQEKAKKLVEDQTPEIEKVTKDFERAKEEYVAGRIDVTQLRAFAKQRQAELDKQNGNGTQFAAAASGADAYSAIVKAQGGSGNPLDKIQEEEIKQSKAQRRLVELNEALLKKQSNTTPVFLKPVSIRGGNY